MEKTEALAWPDRKNPRLSGFDYSSQNYYFVTIVTKGRRCNLSDIVKGQVKYKIYGKIAAEQIEKIPMYFADVQIDRYVVMPNHVHMIVVLAKEKSSLLGRVVGNYKAGVSRRCGEAVWQRPYHDHVIRGPLDYEEIAQYIENNPIRWEMDKFHSIG